MKIDSTLEYLNAMGAVCAQRTLDLTLQCKLRPNRPLEEEKENILLVTLSSHIS